MSATLVFLEQELPRSEDEKLSSSFPKCAAVVLPWKGGWLTSKVNDGYPRLQKAIHVSVHRNTTFDQLAASWDFLQGNTKGGLTFKITTILEYMNTFKLIQCVGSFYLLRCWSIPISASVPGWLCHSHTFTWFTVHPLIFRCLRSRKMTLTGQGYKAL